MTVWTRRRFARLKEIEGENRLLKNMCAEDLINPGQ
jgi:hypothetical protein